MQGTDGTHFGKPQDVAFLPDGRILIADGLDNHRVMIMDKDIKYIGEFGGKGKGPGQFNGVHAVAVGPEGRVFALDRSGNRINVFHTTSDPAKFDFVEAFGGFSLPLDIIVNDDAIWVTDLTPLRFNKLDFKGNHLYTWMCPANCPMAISKSTPSPSIPRATSTVATTSTVAPRSSYPNPTPIPSY